MKCPECGKEWNQEEMDKKARIARGILFIPHEFMNPYWRRVQEIGEDRAKELCNLCLREALGLPGPEYMINPFTGNVEKRE